VLSRIYFLKFQSRLLQHLKYLFDNYAGKDTTIEIDVDNDTMVCWNPLKIKERLNAKSNVSLYSRNSLQSDIKNDEFRTGVLSNGEKIILFNRENLELFFKKLPNLSNFNQTVNKDNIDNVSEPIEIYFPEKINEITEERKERIILKDKLESLKKSRLLKLLYKLGIFKAYKYL